MPLGYGKDKYVETRRRDTIDFSTRWQEDQVIATDFVSSTQKKLVLLSENAKGKPILRQDTPMEQPAVEADTSESKVSAPHPVQAALEPAAIELVKLHIPWARES